ncbi:MAG: hypothetical protein K9L74_05090 [Candidatus Izimaplasma sp.]|nr:hypothetical protein [Candidatus Izimaplasma bacterium]
MGITSFFKNTAETKEVHKDTDLRSHYYKANYKQIKQHIINYCEENDYTVRNIDDDHKEIYVQSRRFHIMVSILGLRPFETAVDFKIQMYTIAGFNRPKKHILTFYEYLDQHLQFKGTSLHP